MIVLLLRDSDSSEWSDDENYAKQYCEEINDRNPENLLIEQQTSNSTSNNNANDDEMPTLEEPTRTNQQQ